MREAYCYLSAYELLCYMNSVIHRSFNAFRSLILVLVYSWKENAALIRASITAFFIYKDIYIWVGYSFTKDILDNSISLDTVSVDVYGWSQLLYGSQY